MVQQIDHLIDSKTTKGQVVDTNTISTDTTLDDSYYIVLCDDDTAGAQFTVTLPLATTDTGRTYFIKKLGTTANIVIDANGSEKIDDGLTATLTTQYEAITVISDGTGWHIV